jgi:hypothetical protein
MVWPVREMAWKYIFGPSIHEHEREVLIEAGGGEGLGPAVVALAQRERKFFPS